MFLSVDDKEYSDNKCYNATLLTCGWVTFLFFGLSLFFILAIPTRPHDLKFTSLTPTPTPPPVNFTSNVTHPTALEKSEEELQNNFAVAGAGLITFGLVFPIVSWLAIIMFRKQRGGDILETDTYGLSIYFLGGISGLAFMFGIMFASGAQTQGLVAVGVSMMVLVTGCFISTLFLSRIYHHQKNEQYMKGY